MLLSIFCWIILLASITAVLVIFGDSIVEKISSITKISERTIDDIFGIIFCIILIITFFSPLYLEFPGTKSDCPAIIKDGEITYHQFGIFEPMAKGKIIRIPMIGINNETATEANSYINKYPRLSLRSANITWKISNIEKFGCCKPIHENKTLSNSTFHLIEKIGLETIRKETEKIVITDGFSIENPTKEFVDNYLNRIRNQLQEELDLIDSGITIVKVRH